MKMRLAVLVTILLSAGLVAGCGSPPATSGKDSETVLVHGVVERDGKPLQDARVWLTLWPEDLDDLPEGGTVDTKAFKPAKTNSDGKYVLSLDPDELTSRYFNGDLLNFDISVSDEVKNGQWGSTVYLVKERFWRQDEQDRIADDVHQIDFDLGKSPSVTLETLDAPDKHELLIIPGAGEAS
ncbi:hypothetical protein [Aeromicrobium sp. UC242_57]|uniref:hypothetical protein n=1 Tax=Aeromicrobium sp. UC242_57 TaxID=3374624 RepID=UPI00379BF3D8